jgi:hypothetical protein
MKTSVIYYFFFGGGSLMKVFAIKAIITAAKINNAITLTPIPAHPPVRKILIGIVNKLKIIRINPRFLSYFLVGNSVLMIKKRKSIKDAAASKRIAIVKESFMKSPLFIDNITV